MRVLAPALDTQRWDKETELEIETVIEMEVEMEIKAKIETQFNMWKHTQFPSL